MPLLLIEVTDKGFLVYPGGQQKDIWYLGQVIAVNKTCWPEGKGLVPIKATATSSAWAICTWHKSRLQFHHHELTPRHEYPYHHPPDFSLSTLVSVLHCTAHPIRWVLWFVANMLKLVLSHTTVTDFSFHIDLTWPDPQFLTINLWEVWGESTGSN